MTLLGIYVGLLAGLAWLLLSGREDAPEPTAGRRVGASIDYGELEQAERDVRDAPDADAVRDWGPGATQTPIA